MAVAVSNFQVPTRCKVGRRKIFAHEKKKIVTVLRKKIQNISTDLTTESVHLLNSSFGPFQTFSAFQQYKTSICNSKFEETMFSRTCTMFDFHIVEQMVTKKLQSEILESWDGVWLA